MAKQETGDATTPARGVVSNGLLTSNTTGQIEIQQANKSVVKAGSPLVCDIEVRAMAFMGHAIIGQPPIHIHRNISLFISLHRICHGCRKGKLADH